ncbi:MAG: 6-phosphogluconolactonase [Cyanobacteria bacterium J06621_11]
MDIATPELIRALKVDQLTVEIYPSAEAVSVAASQAAFKILETTLATRTEARVVFATGRSQKQCLHELTSNPQYQHLWQSVVGFHLDEYLGISANHPASFRHYFQSHLTRKVSLKAFHEIEGDALLPLEVCEAYEKELRSQPIDLCFLGIGNNGHLAFNDPGVTDFSDPKWVKLVRLDEKNRQQQANSTAFPNIEAVPQYAFSLTLSAIRAVRHSLCLAFGEGKAQIVNTLLTGPVSPDCPASILRQFPGARLMIDTAAASKLSSG